LQPITLPTTIKVSDFRGRHIASLQGDPVVMATAMEASPASSVAAMDWNLRLFPEEDGCLKVALQNSATEKWLCAELNGSVAVNRARPDAWEQWTVVGMESQPAQSLQAWEGIRGSGISLRSHHGLFLCSTAEGDLVADRPTAQSWEVFVFESSLPDSTVLPADISQVFT
jgi:hypothetical protein